MVETVANRPVMGGGSRPKAALARLAILSVLGLGLGLMQGWLAAGTYRPSQTAGFYTGFLHGMLMPAALPGLLLGQSVPIYAPNNSGNPYEIGFIFGINMCGLIFFGTAFRQRPRPRQTSAELKDSSLPG